QPRERQPAIRAGPLLPAVRPEARRRGGMADDDTPWHTEGYGGGLYCHGEGSTCSPALIGVLFRGNTAIYSGGAVHNFSFQDESGPSLSRVTFTDTLATEDGGALANAGVKGDSSPTVTNTTFSGNAARDGGAVFNLGRSDGVS